MVSSLFAIVSEEIPVWPSTGEQAVIAAAQADFLLNLTHQGLFAAFAPIHAALGKLPCPGHVQAFADQNAAFGILQNAGDVRAEAKRIVEFGHFR
jgi:hypothetical protein